MMFDENTSSEFFHCTQCGECCRGFGGTYVTDADIDAMADYLGEVPDVIREKYCVSSGSKLVLAQADNGRCVFWDRLCTIHPVKPRMCRRWPFIPTLLVDVSNWHVMADSCPGIVKDADVASLRAYVADALAAEADSPEKGRS